VKFVFIVAAYNVSKWVKINLDSIFNQTYKNFRVIYVDDCSTDNTRELLSYDIQLIVNEKRVYQTYSRWVAYHMCEDDEICVMVDGDDWLIDNYVLEYLNFLYKENDILCTYGQFKLYDGFIKNEIYATRQYPYNIRYRQYEFIAYHLRTGYARLFKAIPVEYLMYNNKWLDRCSDMAEMLCVLELSRGKTMNAFKPLYIYNKTNSLLYETSPFMDKNRKLYENYIRKLKPLN